MKTGNLIICGSDCSPLVDLLSSHFRRTWLAESPEELRHSIAAHRAEVALVDLETLPLHVVRELCREFPSTRIVCMHRLADDSMWTDSLEAGACDCVATWDSQGLVDALLRAQPRVRSRAA